MVDMAQSRRARLSGIGNFLIRSLVDPVVFFFEYDHSLVE